MLVDEQEARMALGPGRSVPDTNALGAVRALAAAAVAGIAIVTLASCAAEQPPAVLLRSSVVERTSANELRIRWPHALTSGPVRIFAGKSPERIDRSGPLVVGTAGSATVHAPPGQRQYFELVAEDGARPQMVAERRLPLEGSRNFRDLGGYETSDGHTVRWGKVYRSDDLANLTPADLDYLGHLGIQLVCDFRSENERALLPSKEFAKHDSTLNLTVGTSGMDPAVLRTKIRVGGIVGLEMEHTLQAAYSSFVTDYTEEWAKVFERLADADSLPAVLHCTAGKDRTGFASALVLLALGVPRETVYADYLLSNLYLENFRNFVLRWTPLYSFFRTSAADLLPLLEARRLYLDTSLATIDAVYGSFDAYLEKALHVDARRRAALRKNLLT